VDSLWNLRNAGSKPLVHRSPPAFIVQWRSGILPSGGFQGLPVIAAAILRILTSASGLTLSELGNIGTDNITLQFTRRERDREPDPERHTGSETSDNLR